MFRNLAILLLFAFVVTSCQNKPQDNLVTEKPDQEEFYETMEDEDQAEKINEQAERDIQEKVEEIEVKDRVFFDYDSAELKAEAKSILAVQAQWLKSDSSIKITIEGHCDERGTREYNIALGEKRANSVKNYLVSKGVDTSRIKIVSYGKEKPAFFGSTPDIWAKNRRAVTVINN